MERNNLLKKYENYILPLLITAVNILIMGICFDFYYDLNDDTMMLDIMSGAYSGMPDGHNMQTLYPLGALLALCYRPCKSIPWYGFFLCLCQFGCFYLAGVRLCVLTGDIRRSGRIDNGNRRKGEPDGSCKQFIGTVKKISILLVLSIFVWGICLSHLVNIQYTVTSAILSATAVFLFLTTPDTDNSRQFVVKHIPSIFLVIIAYQLRSEMLLLTFPFICLAGFYRLVEEKEIFTKETFIRYGSVLGIILAGMLVSRGADYAAYSSAEWKDFLRFFEARTTVYDFYPELINEEEYESVLTELGVTPYQQTLFRNYNYGLDDEIDTDLIKKMADYATSTLRGAKDWNGIVKEQLYRYFYHTFRGGDSPYSTMLLWMYVTVLLAGAGMRWRGKGASLKTPEQTKAAGRQRAGGPDREAETEGSLVHRYVFVWQTALLIIMRSAIWMFILLRGRDPARITHSLYLVEFALLAAMMIRMYGWKEKDSVLSDDTCTSEKNVSEYGRSSDNTHNPLCWISGIMVILFFLIIGGGVRSGVSALRDDQSWREQVNADRNLIEEYCKSYGENFYFEDVYSTVSFSRKIFDGADSEYANYDIMGGWMCGSPLYYDKLEHYDIQSVQKALLEQDNVYLIMSDMEAAEQGFAWIEEYYSAQKITVSMEKTDTIGENYSVYRVYVSP